MSVKKRLGVTEEYQVKDKLLMHYSVQKCSRVFDPSIRRRKLQ